MVNFYYAHYKKQTIGKDGKWHDELYDHQIIVVVANNYDEAEYKIFECLDNMKADRYRAVLTSHIVEAAGLDFSYDFRASLCVSPITEK